MHMPRALIAAVALSAVGLGLSGCASAPTTGSVRVQVHGSATGVAVHDLKVRIVDAHGKTAARATMSSDESRTFSGIPIGKVSVIAEGQCTVATTMDAHGMGAIFSPHRCTLGGSTNP